MAEGTPAAPSGADWPAIDATLARRIRVVGLDVDGTLTDRGIWLGAVRAMPATKGLFDADDQHLEFKRYDIQDGLGITLLRDAGIRVAIVTGRESASVRFRADELRVDALVQDRHARKLDGWRRVLDELGATNEEAAFIGDDLPDLAILREVALPVAVGDAVAEVKRASRLTLARPGGFGAVREFVERLFAARGEWDAVVERYVASRSAGARPAPSGEGENAGSRADRTTVAHAADRGSDA